MDMSLARGLITLLSLGCFIGIVIWAYSPRNRARFEKDGQLPFGDEP
jgi:cytochrome c oxidase cbb3-type subunit 4